MVNIRHLVATISMITERDLGKTNGVNILEKCKICNGTRRTHDNMPCLFCNESGLNNRFAEAFMKNHICLCSQYDRKNCPICRKSCHHSSTLKPRIMIS
jgi:hypothetical protein